MSEYVMEYRDYIISCVQDYMRTFYTGEYIPERVITRNAATKHVCTELVKRLYIRKDQTPTEIIDDLITDLEFGHREIVAHKASKMVCSLWGISVDVAKELKLLYFR